MLNDFSSCYAAARRAYYEHQYNYAGDLFIRAKQYAMSEFAKGECDWWLGLCRAANRRGYATV